MAATKTPYLVLDWRVLEPTDPWPTTSVGPRRPAVVYDADTGRRLDKVQRIEFAAGWVRRCDGSIVGRAMVTTLNVLPDGKLDIDYDAGEIRKASEVHRVRLTWKGA